MPLGKAAQSSPVVFVFVDTEFTCLDRPELISIGLRASDGDEFYCERTDYPRNRCSAFVRSEVLPKLGWSWSAQADLAALAARTEAWLASKAGSHAVVLAYDYLDDLRLTVGLLAPAVRTTVLGLDVRLNTSDDLLQKYFSEPGALRHHALHDARALAYASGPWMSKTMSSLQPVLEHLERLPLSRRLQFLRTAWPELGGAHPVQAINEGRLAGLQELAERFT